MTEHPHSTAAQLLGLLVQAHDLDDFLDRLVHVAAAAVTPAVACGVTVRRDGRPFSVAVSDELAGQVDEIQYGADEGPCLDAMREAEVILVEDLRRERRWSAYRPHAVAHGIASSLSMPLIIEGQSLGAMNLYAAATQVFTAPVRKQAEGIAAQCTDALTLTVRQFRQSQLLDQLAEAMVSSSVIDQAIGILMAQQRCTAATAFDLLRRASQSRNRKLRDVAGDIVTRVSGAPPEPRPDFRD
ncbi:GAF and ANTAR domain-containing protein [Dactylosporangium sp. NPDC050588]|uniref:GAF and ANTAR domain-containing protein n=1 Tax=Dactylosporangium sp. NPDC050588 TaxID=3157211 RepID=UPI0033FC209E